MRASQGTHHQTTPFAVIDRPKFSHWRPTWGPSLSHPMAIQTLHKTVRVRKTELSKADKTDCFENEVESLCWTKFQVPQRTGMTTQNLHHQSQPHLSSILTPVFAAQMLALPPNMQKKGLPTPGGRRMELLCKLSRQMFQFRMLS